MKLIYILLLIYPAAGFSTLQGASQILTEPPKISTKGIDPSLSPNKKDTITYKFLKQGGDKKRLQKMLPFDVTAQNRLGQSIFLFGVIYSDLATIKFINELDPSSIYLRDNQKRTPLLTGLQHNKTLKIIQFIYKLNPGALFEKDVYGNLPLHYVFRYKNNLEVMRFIFKMLPEALFIKRNDGKTPYDLMKKYMPDLTIATLQSRSNKNINKNKNRKQGTRRRSNQCQQAFYLRR